MAGDTLIAKSGADAKRTILSPSVGCRKRGLGARDMGVCFQVGLNSATTGYVFLIIIVLLSIMDSLISSIFFSVIAVGVASRYDGRGARGRHLASGGVSDGQAKRGTTEQHENHIGGPY
jgi:hypothetical protein